MTEAVLVVLALALIAPWLHRGLGGATHWVLGLATGAIALWLASQFPSTAAGDVTVVSTAWASMLDLSLSFRSDGFSVLFAVIISGIGTFVIIYAGGYLKGNDQLGLFYSYILLFMASMLGVVLADNIILLFIAWELTSLSSYLLIGFEHERERARYAALQALLVTGLGGLALLAGLVLIGQIGGSFEISELLHRGDEIRGHALYVPALILVLLGAFTKSAQFPFHFWLPNAMEAPSPVSAYLHSATMVKAGVFLLARMTPILGGTAMWQTTLIVIGTATMLTGAVLSYPVSGLKRILAYSTVSVLGTLTMLIGIGTPLAIEAAMIYLMAHALYKGALFLLAGAVSHATHEYEAEGLSGLAGKMPFCAAAGFVAAMSMIGLPPFMGFLGKEMLYETALHLGGGYIWLTVAVVVAHMLLMVAAVRAGIRPFLGRDLFGSEPQASASAESARPGVRGSQEPAVQEVAPSLWLGPCVLGAMSLLGGLLAGGVGSLIQQPAAYAILDSVTESAPLKLWHGFNLALGLSVLTFMGGLAFYAARKGLMKGLKSLSVLGHFGPTAWYDWALEALNTVARMQTRLLQSGYLRWYLLITLGLTVVLAGYPLLTRWEIPELPMFKGVHHLEIIVAVLILLGAISAARSRSRLAAIASLGVVGYGVALMYVFYGAPDLAMTQFLIETLVLILLILVFYHLPQFSVFSSAAVRGRDVVVVTAFGALITLLVLASASIEPESRISEYFAARSYPEAHGRNIVNVILVDFRAIDTLGEITVLAVAALGVFTLFRLKHRRRENKR
jgi:multicomponent Na+:H+ antiporter subunit A